MKLSKFSQINKRDYDGAEEWFFRFIEQLNPIINEIVTAIGGQLSFPDNFESEYISVVVPNDTDTTITTNIDNPIDVEIVKTGIYDYFDFTWKSLGDKQIKFKIDFASTPTTKTEVTLRVIGD